MISLHQKVDRLHFDIQQMKNAEESLLTGQMVYRLEQAMVHYDTSVDFSISIAHLHQTVYNDLYYETGFFESNADAQLEARKKWDNLKEELGNYPRLCDAIDYYYKVYRSL